MADAPQAAPAAAPAANAAPQAQPNPALTPAPKSPPAVIPPASTKKKYNLKVDGQDLVEEFDPSNEAEVVKTLQMSRAAQKRMQQFAEYEKGVKGLFETLQTDPLKVIGDPRLKIPEETRRKMAEAIINNELQEMQKSPEQREKERIQKEFEELKKQHEAEKTGREKAEFARLQEQQAVQLDNDISSAIEKAKLPKTARTVKYMAEALMFCLENNLDLNAHDVMPYVQKQVMSDFRDIMSALPDDEFEEFMGKDQISRVRKRSLAKLKSMAAAPTANDVKPTGQSSKKTAEPEKKINAKDFFKGLGRF